MRDIEYKPLRDQIEAIVREFSREEVRPRDLLGPFLADVERAMAEPLEMFPVCHHSPASAIQMVRRLQSGTVRVIYLEMCEDFAGLLPALRECEPPVAFQAFAAESNVFPSAWLPISAIAPLTEVSAEFQAIAFGTQTARVEVVFVDRPVDHIFQNVTQDETAMNNLSGKGRTDEEEDGHARSPSVGVQVGDIVPSIEEFLEFLLKNARVQHFSEWWDQYVDQVLLTADYDTYRQVLFLIGSIFRRIGTDEKELKENRFRERYMWTRIKEHMNTKGVKAEEALFVCGAAHTVSDVPEFGLESTHRWEIPAVTGTEWLYGMIPSSFSAIERQFGHFPGMISIAERAWHKGLSSTGLKPFVLKKPRASKKTPQKRAKATPVPTEDSKVFADGLAQFLIKPPALVEEDTAELINYCMEIVSLARKHGYLASTADSIAIFETSQLLAHIRQRAHPSFFDFRDAAVTCLEKDYVPKTKNIRQLCQAIVSEDKTGRIGYTALPPLAQDVYDRLKPLKEVDLLAKTVQRALMDFKKSPELLECSDVLWKLRYLLPHSNTVEPIMGELVLGKERLQESWDIRIGQRQGDLVQLGYEGVTVDSVLEQRMMSAAFADNVRSGKVLQITKDSILLLGSPRLTQELGERARHCLVSDIGVDDAPDNFRLMRELVYYYQSLPEGVPDWVKSYIASGYSHYATLLPNAFVDQGITPEQIAAMLSFMLSLENLAVMMGCSRSQLVIALQAVPVADRELDPNKLGLLWTAQWVVKMRDLDEIRRYFAELLEIGVFLDRVPQYMRGFILALSFAPGISGFLVETISRVYASAPDEALFPWLSNQLLELRTNRQYTGELVMEAARVFPSTLISLDEWTPPWSSAPAVSDVGPEVESTVLQEMSAEHRAVRELVERFSYVIDSLMQCCGLD